MVTYGDGVADVDSTALVAFHRSPRQARHRHRRPAAVSLRRLDSTATASSSFTRSRRPTGWINGGFFVFEPPVLRLPRRRRRASSSASRWSALARDGELMAYRHDGFWQPMDTYREYAAPQRACGPRRGALEGLGR